MKPLIPKVINADILALDLVQQKPQDFQINSLRLAYLEFGTPNGEVVSVAHIPAAAEDSYFKSTFGGWRLELVYQVDDFMESGRKLNWFVRGVFNPNNGTVVVNFDGDEPHMNISPIGYQLEISVT